MFGGEHHVEHEQPGLRNDLWKYDLPSGTWKLVHNGTSVHGHDVPAPRQLAAGCGVTGSYFILFGGLGVEKSRRNGKQRQKDVPLSDTWVFDVVDKQWYPLDEFRTKIGAINQSEAGSRSSEPAARGDMAVWCNENNHMVVFGGFGEGSYLHNDLWMLDLRSLTWKISATSAVIPSDNQFVSHLDYPRGRSGATTWQVKNNLYMFGGNVDPINVRSKHLMVGNVNSMWCYNLETDTWKVLKSEQSQCTRAGTYGKLGVALQSNMPGCRRRAAGWVDRHDNLWMFGGDGVDSSQESVSVFHHSKLLSDIWYFDTVTLMWTWKGGDKTGDVRGEFGTKGERSKDTHPGPRSEAVVWGAFIKFYLFGGIGHDGDGKDGYLNDIWELDVASDPSVNKNSPYAGPVFTIMFWGAGLTLFVVVVYAVGRRCERGVSASRKQHVKYSQLPVDTLDE